MIDWIMQYWIIAVGAGALLLGIIVALASRSRATPDSPIEPNAPAVDVSDYAPPASSENEAHAGDLAAPEPAPLTPESFPVEDDDEELDDVTAFAAPMGRLPPAAPDISLADVNTTELDFDLTGGADDSGSVDVDLTGGAGDVGAGQLDLNLDGADGASNPTGPDSNRKS